MNGCAACRLSVREGTSARSRRFITWDALACCGTGEAGHAAPIDWMQALWPLVLRTSAAASSAAEMTAHSNSMACCQPRRAYGRRACGRAMLRRGCCRARRGRWAAGRPRRTRVLSRTGISSPAVSRLKMVSMEASLGSEPARPSWMEPRAWLSGSVRLIIVTSEVGHEQCRLWVHVAGQDRALWLVPVACGGLVDRCGGLRLGLEFVYVFGYFDFIGGWARWL